MSDDNPHSTNGSSGKSWLDKLKNSISGEPRSKEELVSVITDAEQNEIIDPQTREMIEGVIGVNEMRVRDIMIPRAQMTTIDVEQKVEEFLPVMLESAHSRFPVISEDKDHIEGILLAKDLLAFAFNAEKEFNLRDILRPAVIVPESKRVDVLLKEFRQQRYHMAIVVDEFGDIEGVITLEDIIEEIVGEIEDEYDDEDDQFIRKVSDNNFIIKALTPIDDFNDFFESKLEEEEFDTIGGLISSKFGRLPKQHEEVEINGFMFRVLSADSRRVHLLRMKFSGV